MKATLKWYHSLRYQVSIVVIVMLLLLSIVGGLSLYYFHNLSEAVQAQAEQKLPTLEVLNSTQLGITRLSNLSTEVSHSDSPAHSRILMAKVREQIKEIQQGLDQLGGHERVKALKQIVASVEPSMDQISQSKAKLDQSEALLREKLAQGIRLTTGAIVGAQSRKTDVGYLNRLLINLSRLLTADSLYEQHQIVSNIKKTVEFFSNGGKSSHVYLRAILLDAEGVVDSLEQREKYRSEVTGLNTQNRILLGNVVDFGRRVYADMEAEVTRQANETSARASLFSELLGGILVVQLVIAVLLLGLLHKRLFTRLQALNTLVKRQQSITDEDVAFFDQRNEVGILVKQLQEYLHTIDEQQKQITWSSQQLQAVIKHSQMKAAVVKQGEILFCSEPLRQLFADRILKQVSDFPDVLAQQIDISESEELGVVQEAYFDSFEQRWYDVTRDSILWNAHSASLIGFIDVTAKLKAEQEFERTLLAIENEAYIDPLTGLYNRKMFDRQVEKYQSSDQQENFAILLFDVDHFKGYNDRLGHLQGDVVLKMVANVIQRNTPSKGLAIRYGGEEFIVVLPENDLQLAVNTAQAIVEDVFSQEEPHPTSPHHFLSVSCGVSVRSDSHKSVLQVFDEADKSLYKAKHSGRNCVLVWHE